MVVAWGDKRPTPANNASHTRRPALPLCTHHITGIVTVQSGAGSGVEKINAHTHTPELRAHGSTTNTSSTQKHTHARAVVQRNVSSQTTENHTQGDEEEGVLHKTHGRLVLHNQGERGADAESAHTPMLQE